METTAKVGLYFVIFNLRLVDIILTRKELTGKGTFFVLSKAGVEIETTQCQTLDELKRVKANDIWKGGK